MNDEMVTISKSTLEYNFLLEQGYKQRIEELTNCLKQVEMVVVYIPDELYILVNKTLNNM